MALDRPSIFLAADRALNGAPPGASLLLVDSSGDAVAWSGDAPTFVPTRHSEGAVWSAETVLFYDSVELPGQAGEKPWRLAACWRVARRQRGIELAPRGGVAWSTGRQPSIWGTVLPMPAPKSLSSSTIRIAVAAMGLLLCLSLFLLAARSRGAKGSWREISAAGCLLSGSAVTAVLLPRLAPLEPGGYLKEPVSVLSFGLAAAATALLLLPREGEPRWKPAIVLCSLAFLSGALVPGRSAAVAMAFALTLVALLLAGRGARRPAPVAACAMLAAFGIFAPLSIWREASSTRRTAIRVEAQKRSGFSPEAAVERSSASLPGSLGAVAAGLAGASEQDLSDLAYTLWKRAGLASAAPISGVRLWREGRLVSRFSTGIPIEAADESIVGAESVRVLRRSVPVAERTEFPAGEAPDHAEVEIGNWAPWRELPVPIRDYRNLFVDETSRALPGDSRGETGISGRLLKSFVAATAVAPVVLLLSVVWAVFLSRADRPNLRLRPRTFRGRITALFTILVLVPFVAATIFIRGSLAAKLRQETVIHARTALTTARTVLDDYLSASGSSPGRRQLIDDDLLSWMARIVGHDLSIYVDGRVFSTSRRELFASGLLPERIDGRSFRRTLSLASAFIVESRPLQGRTYEQVEAPLSSLPGGVSLSGPAVISVLLLPERRETEEEIARFSASLTAFSLVVFSLSLVLGARTAFRITGPIGELVEATHAVARGEKPVVSRPSDEELRRLVDAFVSMADTLESQRDDLARAERIQAWAEMARLIAHDIKNPLTPIRLSAEHLREVWRRKDPEAGRILEECVANILKQAETLRATASEFSDYARLPHAHRDSVALRALITDVVADFASAPGVDWRVDVPEVSVRADPKLLARAITNLLSNSLEGLAGRGGKVSVSAKLAGGRCSIRVEDDGPGVPAADLSRLFEPYFSSKSGGTGLGLSIVRKIAQEHGGDARAERLSPRGFAVEFDIDSGNAV